MSKTISNGCNANGIHYQIIITMLCDDNEQAIKAYKTASDAIHARAEFISGVLNISECCTGERNGNGKDED